MKMGTIARIVNFGILVAVLLALLVPAISAFQESPVGDVGMGVPSVYDLDELDAETLASNIETALDGTPGYELSYGSVRTEVTDANLDDVCTAAVASGAAEATLYAPDGKIASQQMILYSNANYQTQITGIMAPGTDSLPLDMTVAIGLKDPQGNVVFRGNSETIADSTGIYLKFQTPTVPYAVAMAAGYRQCMLADGGLDKIFGVDMDLDIKNGQDIEYTVTELAGVQTIVLKTAMAGNCLGTIGDGIAVQSDKATGLKISCMGSASEKLEIMAENGPVDIRMDGKTYTMSQADALGLASMLKVLEGSA